MREMKGWRKKSRAPTSLSANSLPSLASSPLQSLNHPEEIFTSQEEGVDKFLEESDKKGFVKAMNVRMDEEGAQGEDKT